MMQVGGAQHRLMVHNIALKWCTTHVPQMDTDKKETQKDDSNSIASTADAGGKYQQMGKSNC